MKNAQLLALITVLAASCQSPVASVSIHGERYLVETSARTQLDSLVLDAESGMLTGRIHSAYPSFPVDGFVELTLPDGQVIATRSIEFPTTRRHKRPVRGVFRVRLPRD